VKHYSLRTNEGYLHWVRRYIYFHGKRHPREMGGPEVEAFLSHLATEGRVSASTQNQALAGLLRLYREVLEKGASVDGGHGAREAPGARSRDPHRAAPCSSPRW
jgi:hypothetical protein